MADAPPKKAKAVTDWMNKPRQERPDVTEQRRKLWEALTVFIHSNGGNVVPGTKRLRVELPKNSALSARLVELGCSFFARVSFLEYAKFNGVIKQRLTTAEIRQCFRTFHPPFVLIEQGADGRQADLKVERRVRVERA
jgi:hypothetical protein